MNRAHQVAQARFGRALRLYFINGLLIWVPVLVTVLVVRFILDLMDQTLLVLPRTLRPDALLGLHVPGLGALLGLLIVFLTGLLVTNFIGRALVAIGEDLLERIPFVRALYSGVKSFSETVFSKSGSSFKKVLLVEYPRAGLWSMDSRHRPPGRDQRAPGRATGVRVYSTTPNPTSGFIVFVPRSRCIELDMSIDTAMRMIVTLGVVGPGHVSHSGAHPAVSTTATGPRP